MFVVEIFVIGLLIIGIFLTAVAVPIFIKKKTTTIDDLDEVLAGLNEPLALSPKQEQYQKVKEKNKQNSPNAYPGSTLFQFSKKETGDAFTRLTSNIRKETDPKSEQDKFLDAINSGEYYSYTGYKHGDKYEYSTDGHVFTVKAFEDCRGKVHTRTRYADDVVDTDNFYVWGQEEPIYTVSRYYRYETPKSKIKYYIAWDKTFHTAYFSADSTGLGSDHLYQVNISEEDYSAAYQSAQAGDLPWEITNCFNRNQFYRYARRVIGVKYSYSPPPPNMAEKSIVRKTYK